MAVMEIHFEILTNFFEILHLALITHVITQKRDLYFVI